MRAINECLAALRDTSHPDLHLNGRAAYACSQGRRLERLVSISEATVSAALDELLSRSQRVTVAEDLGTIASEEGESFQVSVLPFAQQALLLRQP